MYGIYIYSLLNHTECIKPFLIFFIDPDHGAGQYTEKRIHLSNRLPSWIRSLVPKIFYITEKAWNYYPFTITEYTCSFVPRFAIHIQTKYLNDKGTTDNVSDFFNVCVRKICK